ncbi:MAG: hypothetical protein M0Q90_10540 [Bacteroidales bacterium]|nr:hypothetical protein [Bacteroidales bacterium]
MKKIMKIVSILTIVLFSYTSQAQSPPPPNNNSGGGSANAPSGSNAPVGSGGGGAPIGGGLFILLSLGAAYGGKKVYDFRKQKLDE